MINNDFDTLFPIWFGSKFNNKNEKYIFIHTYINIYIKKYSYYYAVNFFFFCL